MTIPHGCVHGISTLSLTSRFKLGEQRSLIIWAGIEPSLELGVINSRMLSYSGWIPFLTIGQAVHIRQVFHGYQKSHRGTPLSSVTTDGFSGFCSTLIIKGLPNLFGSPGPRLAGLGRSTGAEQCSSQPRSHPTGLFSPSASP